MVVSCCVFLLVIFCCVTRAAEPATTQSLPTLYIIGDSTVHNTGAGLVGWGDCIGEFFDTSRINIENRAIAGRSSRTFMTEGRWDKIVQSLKPGDFVLMQFGHNDGSPVNDTSRARGSLKGTGEETEEIDNQLTGKHEVVHTYGWYMRKFVTDAKSKGATPIVLSLVARNMWKDGKIIRSTDTYVAWAKAVAEAEHVPFIDLNDLTANNFEALGADKTNALFPSDHTHTNQEGAKLNAKTVVEGLKILKDCPITADLR